MIRGEVIDGPIDDPSYEIVGIGVNTDLDVARDVYLSLLKLAIVQLEDNRPHDRGEPYAFKLTSWVEEAGDVQGHALAISDPRESDDKTITGNYYLVSRDKHTVTKGPIPLIAGISPENRDKEELQPDEEGPIPPWEVPLSANHERIVESLDRRELLLVKYMLAKALVAASEFESHVDRDVFLALMDSNISEVASMYPKPQSSGAEIVNESEHLCDDTEVRNAINGKLEEMPTEEYGSKQGAFILEIDEGIYMLRILRLLDDESPYVALIIKGPESVAAAYDPDEPENKKPFPCSKETLSRILEEGSQLSIKRFESEYMEAVGSDFALDEE